MVWSASPAPISLRLICFFVLPARAGIHTQWLFWCDHSLCADTQTKATPNSWAHGVDPISDPAPPRSPGPTTPRVPSLGGWEGEWAGDARNSWAHGVHPIDAPTSPQGGGEREHGDPIATYSRFKERPPNAASPHKSGLYHLSGLLTRAARAAP